MWLLGEKSRFFETRETNDLEDTVTRWIARQDPAPWVPSAIVLSTLLIAMVLFALAR